MKIQTAAVVFGTALAEAAGNPLHLSQRLSLSSASPEGGDDAMVKITTSFLNQCAGAGLNTDSCLVSKTVAVFADMDGPPGDPPLATSSVPTPSPSSFSTSFIPGRRSLQQDEDCDGAPELDEATLRFIMSDANEQCGSEGLAAAEPEFESAMQGFLTIFSADQCFQDLCSGPEGNALFMEIMFAEGAQCALGREPQMNECIIDQFLEMLSGDDDKEASGSLRRKLQGESGCEPPNEAEVSWYVSSLILPEAEAKCSELGVALSVEEREQAVSELTSIFAAPHCFGEDPCENDDGWHDDGWHDDGWHDDGWHDDGWHDDGWHDDGWNDDGWNNDDGPMGPTGGINYFEVAVKYVEQCAGITILDAESCLVTATLDTFAMWGASPIAGHRFLQEGGGGDECAPPELDEATLRYIIEGSKQTCLGKGLVVSEQEFEATVGNFGDLLGAGDCWASLCEDEPNELLLQIMLEEMASCADAAIGEMNPCLRDTIFAFIFAPDSPSELDGVRRKLERAAGVRRKLEGHDEPCDDQVGSDEIGFLVGIMLAGAQEQCVELGSDVPSEDIAFAYSELTKLFTAQHCWGVSSDCGHNDDELHGDNDHDNHYSYSQFVEDSATWMLAQCAAVEDIDCVFSRSIEVMHGMKDLGWAHDGHADTPQHLAQSMAASICAPPTVDEYDVEQIVGNAMQYCMEKGVPMAGSHAEQLERTVADIKKLVAKPDCWEDLCHPMARDIVTEEWMHTCALQDLGFLTAHGPHTSGDVHLESDRLRCMAHYIAAAHGKASDNWACSLPHLGHGACDADLGRDAYLACGGQGPHTPGDGAMESHEPSPATTPLAMETPAPSPQASDSKSPSPPQRRRRKLSTTHAPTPSKPLMLSMSFAYDDDFDWLGQYEDEMSFSMPVSDTVVPTPAPSNKDSDDEWHMDDDWWHFDDGFSMKYDDDYAGEPPGMDLYIEEVCSLLGELNTEKARHCLRPVCDLSLDDILAPGEDQHGYDTAWPTPAPSRSPTKTAFQTTQVPTTASPTTAPPTTASPTLKPTQIPTREPTASPTLETLVVTVGSVEVAIEVEIVLEGWSVADLDVTELDKVVDVLSEVLKDTLPEGATVRILSIGGFSVARRLLRFLQEDSSSTGVAVEFEIITTQTCAAATCSASEVAEISSAFDQEVSSSLENSVQSGELSTKIKEEAQAAGVDELSNVSINSVQVSEATVTVREADDNTLPVDPTDDDDSASGKLAVGVAGLVVVFASLLV